MRILALIANAAWLFFFAAQIAGHGFSPNSRDVLVGALVFATLILNLVVLYRLPKGDGWLALYFKRKALEERKKIDELGEHAVRPGRKA
jgi:hypothetical protein